jgi:hypothetical protein
MYNIDNHSSNQKKIIQDKMDHQHKDQLTMMTKGLLNQIISLINIHLLGDV